MENWWWRKYPFSVYLWSKWKKAIESIEKLTVYLNDLIGNVGFQTSTVLVPAIKDEKGNFYFSEDVPVDKKEGWRKLPTRLEDN